MRKTAIVLSILVCVTCVVAFQASHASADSEAAIKQAVLKVHQAMTDSGPDVDRFFDFILDFDNGMIIQDGVLFKTSNQAYDAVKKGYDGLSKVERVYDQTYVQVLSSESAVLTGTGNTTVTLTDGRTFDSKFAVSMVFVLRDGQWKVLHGHYSAPNPQ
jgi:hypothetical protein